MTLQELENSLKDQPLRCFSFQDLALDSRIGELGRIVLSHPHTLVRAAWEEVADEARANGLEAVAALMLGESREVATAAAMASA